MGGETREGEAGRPFSDKEGRERESVLVMYYFPYGFFLVSETEKEQEEDRTCGYRKGKIAYLFH